jgi:hypothetical protein
MSSPFTALSYLDHGPEVAQGSLERVRTREKGASMVCNGIDAINVRVPGGFVQNSVLPQVGAALPPVGVTIAVK